MDGFLSALLFSCLPFAGNFIGGLLAEWVTVTKKSLSIALHAAAGILIAVVGIELMPKALQTELKWIVLLAFLAGGCFSIFLDHLVDRFQSRQSDPAGQVGPWMIYLAVCTDLFSDGLMLGAGSTVSSSFAFILALGQVGADLPEGFATIATLKNQGYRRAKRFLFSVGFAVPLFAGTLLGYWIVRDQPDVVKFSLLSFTAAILLKAAVEDVIGEAHESSADSNWQTMSLIGGFALFCAASVYLE